MIKTDKHELGIIGRVQSLNESEFRAVPSFWNGYKKTSLQRSVQYFFDKKGNLIKSEMEFDFGDGMIYSTQKYQYNEINQKVSMISCSSNGEQNYSEFYKYDELGCKTEILTCCQRLEEKTVFKYNSIGYLKEKIVSDYNNIMKYWQVYKNSEEGLVTELFKYNQNGALMGSKKFWYDDKNNIIEIEYLQPDGKVLKEQIDYKYDSNGNWSHKLSYNKHYFSKSLKAVVEHQLSYYNLQSALS